MKLKSATLELIAAANNKPTGDELRQHIIAEDKAVFDNAPVFLTSRQRKRYKQLMSKLEESQ